MRWDLPWLYPMLSVLPLALYALMVPVWQHPRRTGLTTNWTGMLFGTVIALNCIWWFLRCPRQHGVLKGITFLLMVLGIFQVLLKGYLDLAYYLYGH
jgi:hypothetical protein